MAAKKTAKKPTPAARAATVIKETPATQKVVTKAAAPKVVTKDAALKVVTKVAALKVAAKPSIDELARAAYLNYRRRVELGLPGDSHGDWLEAERFFSSKSE